MLLTCRSVLAKYIVYPELPRNIDLRPINRAVVKPKLKVRHCIVLFAPIPGSFAKLGSSCPDTPLLSDSTFRCILVSGAMIVCPVDAVSIPITTIAMRVAAEIFCDIGTPP